jgi:acetylglutamate kinase
MLTVLKVGGELLETPDDFRSLSTAIVRLSRPERLVVVHGGGRAIDAELRARGETPKFVDGLRVTDESALLAVVSVLAGRTNTALVAAIGVAGGRAVGLTGADGQIGLATKAAPFTSTGGNPVDLGLVGEPDGNDGSLLLDLVRLGCIPVVASIGVARDGALLNVNADTLAAHLAAVLAADRLIIAGATAGVLDSAGVTIAELSVSSIEVMTASGAAHSGMVAKLAACRSAALRGVPNISIVSGREISDFNACVGTVIRAQPSGDAAARTSGKAMAHLR